MNCENRIPYYDQVILFINLSLPSIACNIFSQLHWSIASTYVGKHEGAQALAALSVTVLGSMLARVLLFGVLSGFDTLAGNAVGAKQYKELGCLLQSTFFIIGIIAIPSSIIYYNIGLVLELLSQPESVKAIAIQYIRIYIIVYPIEASCEILKSYFKAQNVTFPFVFIYGFATVLQYVYIELFANVMIGFLFTYASILVMTLCLFCFKYHEKEAFPSFSLSETMSNTRIYRILSLGLPGIISMSDWLFYEFQTVLVGTLGEANLVASSVAYFTLPYTFFLVAGVSEGAATRIATLVGEENISMAKRVALATFVVNGVIGVASFGILVYFQENIYSLYLSENDTEALAVLRKNWVILSAYTFFNCTLASAQGVYRGFGLQMKIAKIIIVSLWVIGAPMQVLVVKVWKFGYTGLWASLVGSFALMDVFFILVLINSLRSNIIGSYSKINMNDDLV